VNSDYMRDYMRKRRQSRREKFIEMLGGKCQHCGSRENLEFDHRNPKRKSFDLNEIKDGPEKVLLKELRKCTLLCRPCHLLKTKENKENLNKDKKPARHGTIWMYKKYKCRCYRCRRAMREYRIEKIKINR